MHNASQTRERIDRAAIRLFVERGIDGTSIRQIAKEAGISVGALYNHYPSKEDMALTLFSDSWAAVGHELRLLARESDDLEKQLQSMIYYVFDLFERDWELASFNFLQRQRSLRKLTSARSNPYLVFRMLIVAAINSGEIPRQDPDIATAMLMGTIVQIIDTKILGRIRKPLLPLAESVAGACLDLLRAADGVTKRRKSKHKP